jgi:S1-C subfamily serine protease
MKSAAWIAVLALACAPLAHAQPAAPSPSAPSPRAPINMTKVVSSIPDGVEWATLGSGDGCKATDHLQWNVGRGAVDVSRLAQPARDQFRHDGLAIAADPVDPFGARVTSDLMVGATITGLKGTLCGGDLVTGQVQMQVVWEVYSASQKRVVLGVRTTVTTGTRDKPIPIIRLMAGAMGASATQLMLNGGFEKLLVAGPSAAPAPAPGSPATTVAGSSPPTAAVYGPAAAKGDYLPHPGDRMVMSGLGTRGMKLTDALDSVVSLLRPGSIGSGFLVSRDGYIVTAAHVVGTEQYMKVRWSDGYETTGQVVRRDNRRDVALIKTDSRDRRPLAMRLPAPRPGETVFAIGAPVGLQGTLTKGIVSTDRVLDNFSFIQSDVSINPGNSGGPLLDERGQVLGIADLQLKNSPGLNFFVPIGDALVFLGVDPQ